MKRVVVVSFAYFDRKLKRVNSWGDVILTDVYKPEELAECDQVRDIKQRIKDMGLGGGEFLVTFSDVTEKIISEFSIENIDLLHKMAGLSEPYNLFEPKLWRDKIGDSMWHCAMVSVNGPMIEEIDETMEGAIRKCHDRFVELSLGVNGLMG